MRRLDETVASVFDTVTFTVVPQAVGLSVNHRAGEDGSRQPFDFKGSIDINPPVISRRANLTAEPTKRDPAVAYEAVVTAYASSWPYLPKPGDLLRENDSVWKIADTDRDGSDRRVFYVNQGR